MKNRKVVNVLTNTILNLLNNFIIIFFNFKKNYAKDNKIFTNSNLIQPKVI